MTCSLNRNAATEPPNPEPITMALKFESAGRFFSFLQEDNEKVLQPKREAVAKEDNPKNLRLFKYYFFTG